jgi:hypothetical protein
MTITRLNVSQNKLATWPKQLSGFDFIQLGQTDITQGQANSTGMPPDQKVKS